MQGLIFAVAYKIITIAVPFHTDGIIGVDIGGNIGKLNPRKRGGIAKIIGIARVKILHGKAGSGNGRDADLRLGGRRPGQHRANDQKAKQ